MIKEDQKIKSINTGEDPDVIAQMIETEIGGSQRNYSNEDSTSRPRMCVQLKIIEKQNCDYYSQIKES